MKYFVKYIPVEEIVKAGDMVLKPPVNAEYPDSYIEEVDDLELETISKGRLALYKKVKLYICSRDIEAGDTIWNDAVDMKCGTAVLIKNGICYYSYLHADDNSEQEDDLPIDQLYKLIAEISKAAIWVSEGDEFTDDDIQWIYSLPVDISNPAHKITEYPEFSYIPTDDDLEDWSHDYFLRHGGRGTSWELKDVFVKKVKLKCKNCNTYH